MRKGYDVLRFDYRGTGDSSGEPEEFSANDWIDDIGTAADELRETANVSNVSLIGLRLGALLAAAACSKFPGIDQLVLWDPVLSGAEYDAELVKNSLTDLPDDHGVVYENGPREDGSLSYNGFVLSAQFRESISSLNLPEILPRGVRKILQVVSHEATPFETLQIAGANHPGFAYQLAPAPHDWNYVDNFGGILLPQPVIQAIVQWFHPSTAREMSSTGGGVER
jgi:pimeloyl-ACP methyl ester carboxylesterase